MAEVENKEEKAANKSFFFYHIYQETSAPESTYLAINGF
jgi:hypothetical protein